VAALLVRNPISTGDAEFISRTINKAAGPGVSVHEDGWGMCPGWPADQAE